MDITLDNIRPGTIIVTAGKLAIVEEVKPSRRKNPIAYKNNVDHRGYICGIGEVQAILGDVDLVAWKAGVAPPAPKRERFPTEDRWAMPDNLKEMGLKVGDIVEIRSRRGTENAIYKGYHSNRPKNPVELEIGGKNYKAPANLIVQKVRDGASQVA